MCQSVFSLLLGNVGGVIFGGRSTACRTCQGRVVASQAVPVDRLRDGSGRGMHILGKECRGTSGVGHREGFPLGRVELECIHISSGLLLSASGAIWCNRGGGIVRSGCDLLGRLGRRDIYGCRSPCNGQYFPTGSLS
jgi:hypothetical protein